MLEYFHQSGRKCNVCANNLKVLLLLWQPEEYNVTKVMLLQYTTIQIAILLDQQKILKD